MSQKSLSQWFGNNEINQRKFKNAFFYDVNKNQVSWINQDDLQGNLDIKKTIKWRDYKYDVVVCCNINKTKPLELKESENRMIFNIIDRDKVSKLIPLYKSHLQKCIRRGLSDKAVKTAKNLIELNFLEFVRRISIIMLEDCVIHESFSKLSWMVAAFPEWIPTLDDLDFLINLVKYLADLELRNQVKKSEFNMKQQIKTINNLEEPYLSLIYSLNFRKSFGGLTGDMLMLSYFSKYWLEHFKNLSQWEKDIIHYPIKNDINYEKVELINFDEIEKSAIDFHIFPKMVSLIYEHYRNDVEKDKLNIMCNHNNIKLAIWYLRSSINTKKFIDIELKDTVDPINHKYTKLFNIIKDYVEDLSHRYLMSLKK